MSKIDDLLKQIEEERKKETVTSEPAKEVVPVQVIAAPLKSSVPWMNIFMFSTILVMGYFLFTKDNSNVPDPGPDPIPVINVTDEVTKYEKLYSTYKSQSYNKMAELVENKTINNRSQLMTNTQAVLEKAREASIGKLDELDNQYLPEESFDEKRSEVVSYLKQKANGFEKAGK